MKIQSEFLQKERSHKWVTRIYEEVENKLDTRELTLYGVNIWPLIRLQIGDSFKSFYKNNLSENNIKTKDTIIDFASMPYDKSQRLNLIKQHKNKYRINPHLALERHKADLDKLKKISGLQFIVQTKIEKYYLKKSGGFYAPILDPVYEDLIKIGKCKMLSLEPLPITCLNEPLKLDMEAYLISKPKTILNIPINLEKKLSEVEIVIGKIWPSFRLNKKNIFNRYNQLKLRRDFFFEIYKILKPECIFLSSFTGWLHSLWAAKDLNIPVIDIQHGGQGNIHLTTSHYSNHPKQGYHFLPDIFWLWGKYNYNYASEWNPGKAINRHIPVIGGHRGVAKWYNDMINNKLNFQDNQFIKKFSKKNNVLITLSYASEPLIPEKLYKSIKLTPEINWLIRLHPINRSNKVREQIKNKLNSMGCMNYFIDEPTDVQLQSVLYVSNSHITPFSTAFREALAFGVPSAVCDIASKDIFINEIDSKLINYLKDESDIIDFINTNSKKKIFNFEKNDLISIDDNLIDKILNNSKLIKEKSLRLNSNFFIKDQIYDFFIDLKYRLKIFLLSNSKKKKN